MMIQSTRLGNMDVSDEHVIEFPEGIPGFETERRFAMIEYQENTPFVYLQSLLTAELTFLAADPFAFFNDYQIDLSEKYEKALGLDSDNPPYIVCMTTVPHGRVRDMTVNLLAPVVINLKTRLARQIVLENVPYTTKHRIFPDAPADKGGK